MKKILIISTILFLMTTLVLTGCSSNNDSNDQKETAKQKEEVTIKVGATPVPHAEILEQVKPILAKQGIHMEIVEFTDYVQPNVAVADGNLDYNFFQHEPYLKEFAQEHQLDIVGGVKVHLEPMGLYSTKISSLDKLEKGSEIAIPNDVTNGGRALLLLEKNGLIELKKDAGLEATENDIESNPKNLKFIPLEAAQLPRSINDVDAAVINTNYALEADLNPLKDAIIIEDKNSPYANLIAMRKGEENSEVTKAFEKALTSNEIKEFIETTYKGAIIPAFE